MMGHIIQIDNAHPASFGECTSILLDAKPFELLPKYNIAEIEAFFKTLSAKGRENVSCYVSDMTDFLLALGRRYFPYAIIVADPYHVVRLLFKSFDDFLKRYEEDMLVKYIRAIDDERIVRPVRPLPKKVRRKKNSRQQENLLEADPKKEDEEKVRRRTAAEIRILLHTKIGEMDETHKAAVRFLLVSTPKIKAAYYYLQSVLHLYHVNVSASNAGASAAAVVSVELSKFEARLPEHARKGLEAFLDTCRENRDVICGFWLSGWTNAEVESQNRLIKQLNGTGRGLDFEELRRRWLHQRSMSSILGRDSEKILGKKNGVKKKSIRELKKLPPPQAVPVEGPYGQRSIPLEWQSQDDQASVEPEDDPNGKPPDSDSDSD